jgi:hypothetical protein
LREIEKRYVSTIRKELHMRFNLSLAAAATAVIALAVPFQARAADALTGKMNVLNYAIGSWTCTANVPAMGAQPAHPERVTATFEAVPGNVLHDHVVGSVYVGDDYFGYSSDGGAYWMASVNNSGEHGSATSPDGTTYSGTSTLGPVTMSGVTTYTKVSDSNITVHVVISGKGQQLTVDSDCRR